MKIKILLIALFALTISCKNNAENPKVEIQNQEVKTTHYPKNMLSVFNAHGGLDTWNSMNALVFTMEKPNGKEVTYTNLKSRESLIKLPEHTIGYTGSKVWLDTKGETAYKGNPKFYYNLMFYFKAMPFVLADDGIIYTDVKPLVFEGKSYPGIKISYKANIGESPDDEYILYYDAATNKMAWLGYTVTYFSKEKSKEFHFIKYDTWQTINGVDLPKTISWYKYEDGKITTKRNDVTFTEVQLQSEAYPKPFFAKPETAKIIE